MSKFSRSSSWLRQIFTPSSTGWREPGELSRDVSLIQPYDGGGYPLPGGQQRIFENLGVTTPAAEGTELLASFNSNSIHRIVSCAALVAAGVAPSFVFMVREQTDLNVPISEPQLANTAVFVSGNIISPIIGPSMDLYLQWWGGDASTDLNMRWCVYQAPIGSVFYV